MPTFSFYINGDLIVEAEDFDSAYESTHQMLSEVMSDFTIDAAYDSEGGFIL